MKKNLFVGMLVLATLIVCATTAWCGVYKYKDKNGSLNFVDSPDKIPEEYREKTLKMNITDDLLTESLEGKSFDEVKQLAVRGHLKAQHQTGSAYLNGKGVSKNTAEAIKWFSKAADRGYVKSLHNLGVIYIQALGVSVDTDKAKMYFEAAASQGFSHSQVHLGIILSTQGREKEAVEWYLKAASQGNADAMYNMGEMYKHGAGVERNAEEAARWYEKAEQAQRR